MKTKNNARSRNMVSRREFLRLTGVSAGSLFLAACGGAPAAPATGPTAAPAGAAGGAAATPQAAAEPTAAPAAAAGATTVEWFNAFTTASTKEVIPIILQEFQKLNPGVTVQQTAPEAGGDFMEALLARIAAGSPPDAATIASTPAELAARGSLLAIDDRMQTAQWARADAFYPAPLKSCQWQGKTYGLPSSAGAGSIFLNVALFKEKGISTKREDFPKTWDELKALSQEFVVKKGDTIERAGLVPWTAGWLNHAWSGTNGGKLFDAANNKYTLASDQNVEWLEYWVRWLDEQYGGDIEKLNTSARWGDTYPETAFALGRQAMALGGSWETTDSEIPFEWEVAKLPVGPSGSKSVTGFWPNWWVLPLGSKQPDEAFKFIEYFSTQGWVIWYRAIMDTPAWKDFPADALTTKLVDKAGAERAKDIHNFFATYLEDAVEMWNSPIESFANDTLNAAVDEVLHKTRKPREALENAQTICQAKLDETLKQS